jgi:hypothetical protein
MNYLYLTVKLKVMKKIFLPLAGVMAFLLSAEYSSAQLKERWKESSRLSKREKEIEFSDTTWLIGGDKPDEMFIRRGAFMYRGDFKRSKFMLSDREYLVVSRDENEIRLKDQDGFTHIYRPDTRDSSAMDAPAKMAEHALPEQPVTSVDMNKIAGKWDAYKRNRKPGTPLGKINYNTLLKGALILASPDAKGHYGVLSTSAVKSEDVSGTYKVSITRIEAPYIYGVDAEGKEHKLTIWRSTEEELVFEDEDNMLYYCKKF